MLPRCAPIKRVFTVNQKAVWFTAMVVGKREHSVWLLNRRWLLFKFNEVKKSKLIDCRHMQESSESSHKFFWNSSAYKVAVTAS